MSLTHKRRGEKETEGENKQTGEMEEPTMFDIFLLFPEESSRLLVFNNEIVISPKVWGRGL